MDGDQSVREAIESAIDGGGGAPAPDLAAPAATPASPAAQAPVSAGAPAPAAAAEAPATTTQRNLFDPAPKLGALEPKAPAQLAAELKAPASWKADLRESWKALPPAVQSEVIRRERENDARMQEHAGTRKFAERFQQITDPYRAFIEAEGADPLNAFHDYLKTATMLRMGAPLDKARLVAGLVQQYQIPLQALDAYLAQSIQHGPLPQQLPQQMQMQQQPQAFRDPRLDQLLQMQEQRDRAALTSDIDTFAADPKNEFFGDVRDTMADVLEAAAKRGVVLSLGDAYARACQIEPEVKKTIDARAARGGVSQAARALAAARHAASSVPSQPAAPALRTANASPGSVRDSILGAIDQLTIPA